MSKWFKGLRLKLLLLVLFPVVALALVSWRAAYDLNSSNKALNSEITERLPITMYSGEMQTTLNQMVRYLWASYGSRHDVKGRERGLELFERSHKNFLHAKTEYLKLPRPRFAVERFAQIEKDLPAALEAMEKARKALEAGGREAEEVPLIITQELRQAMVPVEEGFTDLDKVRAEVAAKDSVEITARARAVMITLMVVCVAVCLGVLAFGIWVAASLAKNLGGIAVKLQDSGLSVQGASTQLSEASQRLSAGSSEAAASLEETVASLEELGSMVARNADNAKEASALSATARQAAEEGESEMHQLIGAMGEISQSSRKIEEIINVIDDIAFQTNLLALNAAVEAARAGEQGRGFAVVADAVRSLAQRSSAAAKDITTLIKDSVGRVERGTDIAGRSESVLKNIVVSVKKVADLNNEISAASQEQSTGLGQISKAMNQLDQATQGNASSAEETHAASEQMSEEAGVLHTQVSELISLVEGTSHTGFGSGQKPRSTHVKPVQKASPIARIVSLKKADRAQTEASKVIPFEENESESSAPVAKVGNLDGF